MIRKIFHGFFLFLYPTLLISGVLSASIALVVGTPKHIENALDKSGLYTVAIDSALSNIKQNTELNEVSLSDPGIQNVIKQTFPPDYLKKTTEGVIDSFYDWFNGKTKTPEFTVDLTEAKTALATNLGAYASTRLASLPACAKGTPAIDVDPLTTTCVPAGFDVSGAAASVQNQILQSTDLFKQTTYTINDLKNEQGQASINQYQTIPAAFKAAVWSAWITLALAVLSAVGVVFLAVTRRRGMRSAGIISAVCGFIILAMAWLGGFATDKLATKLATENGADVLKINVAEMVRILTGNVFNLWLWFGMALAVIGIALFAVQHFTAPKGDKPKKEVSDDLKTPPYLEETDEKKSAEDASKTASKTKTSKKVNVSG